MFGSPMLVLSILQQFLDEECTPGTRDLILPFVGEQPQGSVLERKRFEFNRFDLTIDLREKLAIIEDVLDPSEVGVARVPLAEFAAALIAHGS